MSMFGGFDTSWTSGFSQLNQLTESLQKIKTDIEHNLESSLGIPHLTSGGDESVKPDGDGATSISSAPASEEPASTSTISFFPAAPQTGAIPQAEAPPPPPQPAAFQTVKAGDQTAEPSPSLILERAPVAEDAVAVLPDAAADGWGDVNLDESLPDIDPTPLEENLDRPTSDASAEPALEIPGETRQQALVGDHSGGPGTLNRSNASSSQSLDTGGSQHHRDGLSRGESPAHVRASDGQGQAPEVRDINIIPSLLPSESDIPVTPSRLGTGVPAGLVGDTETDAGDGDETMDVADVTSKLGDALSVRAPAPSGEAHSLANGHVGEPDGTMEADRDGEREGDAAVRMEDGNASPRSVGEGSDAGSGEHPPESIASAASHVGGLPDGQRGRDDLHGAGADVDVANLGVDEVRTIALELRAVLRAREEQLERLLEESASLREVAKQLQEKNAELALKAHKVSEEDLEALRAEFEERLGAAERKVYVLTKERDALRRGSEKLTASTDLLKEKDAIISQVMEEGEKLSKKQLAQENTMKKLRQEIQDLILQKSGVSTSLTQERQKAEAAISARAKVEAELASLRQAHRAELDAEKAHYEGLLQKTRAAQAEAEEKARVSAKEGLARKLKDAEVRAETLGDSVEELRAGLERQRAAADLREDMLKREMADLERRCQEAEARHEELAAKLPEATRPLLRQMEAMQAAAAGQQQAWLAAERTLSNRLHDAEAATAAAGERERLATDRLAVANSRASAAAAALEEVRMRMAEVQAQVEEEQQARSAAEARARTLEDQLRQAVERYALEVKQRQEMEQAAGETIEAERRASVAQLATAESRVADLEKQLRAACQMGPPVVASAPLPPAMAGPGYKWVLVKEGEDVPDSPMSGRSSLRDGSLGGLPPLRSGVVEVERLRDVVRHKEDQLAALQQQLAGLESTRDSLAEELLRASHAAEGAAQAQRELAATRKEHEELHEHLLACTEMLGERDERLGELEADVADVKALYKDQIVFMVERLAVLEANEQARTAGSSNSATNASDDEAD